MSFEIQTTEIHLLKNAAEISNGADFRIKAFDINGTSIGMDELSFTVSNIAIATKL